MPLNSYKTGKNPDIYAKDDRKSLQNKRRPRKIKIFGFRSGVVYKMIPAILYYAFAWFYIGVALYGEVQFLKFEAWDFLFCILKYAFFFVILFSPALFLSDFKYVDALPLFRKRQAWSSFIGLIFVWTFCYFMMNVNVFYMSDTYKNSVREYNQTISSVQEQKEKESETTIETESTQ